MDDNIIDIGQLPPGVGSADIKEKSTIHGNKTAIHTWWSRRSGAFSRVATYLGLTHKRDIDLSFLEALAAYPPSANAITVAARHVRDTQWRQAWCDVIGPQSSSRLEPHEVPELSPLRVLDPFCGAGGIPLEAARLGCSAYANDLSPVAFHITQATAYFPGKFGRSDAVSIGTNQTGQWAGLSQELIHWTKVVSEIVAARIEPLFPSCESHTFIWFQTTTCPSCGATVPLQARHILARGQKPTQIILSAEGAALEAVSSSVSNTHPRLGSALVCLACGLSVDFTDEVSFGAETPLLAAVLNETGFQSVARSEMSKYYRWVAQYDQRITELTDSGWQNLNLPLPQLYTRSQSLGCNTFADLFTPRQRLVALEYAAAVREAAAQMERLGITAERVEALVTYLAFLVDFIVERNSKLCRWNPNVKRAEAAFARASFSMPRVFVETHPRRLVAQWLDRILPALDGLSTTPPIESATCGDARQLPYPENFFDAVITDPPYFDNIPYSELAEYFWVWERPLLDLARAKDISIQPNAAERIQKLSALSREALKEHHWQAYSAAISEIYRVLKPGKLFTLIFTAPQASVFDTYIALSEEAGFEIFTIRHIEENTGQFLPTVSAPKTYQIFFRKPQTQNSELRSESVSADQILKAVESNRPVFYEGLAQLLLDELDEIEIQGLLAEEYKGATFERLMEVLADRDPRELLTELFGGVGVRRLVKRLGIVPGNMPVTPEDSILSHFGFATPTPRALHGAHQVGNQLRQLISRVDLSEDKATVRGLFNEGSTSLERLLRSAVWAWATLAFGENRDKELLRVLQESPEGKDQHYSLNRLSFGIIAALFRRLPDAIAQSSMAPLFERKLGRRHVYNPMEKGSKLSAKLNELVTIRNKIEHDKEGFWSKADLRTAKACVSDALAISIDLVSSLAKSQAIPAWAYVTHQIQDAWSRTTYKFVLDDGTLAEARFTHGLNLGGIYLYFAGNVNPRPVDPLVVSSDQQHDVP